MNPDRATLNFLNSFPEKARKRGDSLQEDGAVTQIFGNHLFIQGRVEDATGTFRTSLRLQGNRWFGSCTAEDEEVAGACMYATMMERMHRGEDLPESPNEFDDTPIIDVIEDKLGRELDDKEADFIGKVEKRYRRYVIEGEIHDHDMVRLNPRWEIIGYDALELWPMPPGDILEFWNYIAYAFYKKKLPYPEFLNAVTDLEGVQKKMQEWEREREVAEWYDRIESVNERPPMDQPKHIEFRLLSTINEARVEYKEHEEWLPLREKTDIDRFVGLFEDSALRMDSSSQLIWEQFLTFYNKNAEARIDLDSEESCQFMNRIFRQPALKGYVVNLDEREFKVVDNALKWICEDDPYAPDSFALQLVTESGEHVTHSVRLLPGREVLYQSDETVFPGPPRWLSETDVQPRYHIPKNVIDSLEGVEFLRKIGSSLPESLRKRVTDLDLYPRFKMKIEQGLTAAETEHLVIDVRALEKKERREEKRIKDEWELVEQQPVKGKQLLRFAREELYPVPSLLAHMGLTYDEKLDAFKSRITKLFPEKFAEWAKNLPESIVTEMDGKLQTLLADPVTAAIRFEVVNQEIDWFDLRIVIDVEGVTLTNAQIRSLVAARGGYVRMDDGGWMRLEIKLDADQRDAVTRLGLDPFDLTGETHRMHALQLADPKAAEVFDPKAWKRIKDRSREIQLEVDVPVPKGLNATLRPYQVDGFRFLAYLAVNRFGGLLADDMGLGKTIQSITYLLWLREEEAKKHDGDMSKVPPSLVVCPKSVIDVWHSETEKFAPGVRVKILRTRDDLDLKTLETDVDLFVLNYAQLRLCGEELAKVKWLTSILDEGQQIKNPDSKAAKAARDLNSMNRLVLTGTPIENRLMDMWSLMSFAMPGVLGSRAYFKKRFDKRKDPGAQSRLASRLRPFLLRRTKLQVAKDLPPRTEEEVFAEMEGVQAEMYKAELKRIQKALLGFESDEAVKKNSFAILQGLMRLRQICCHPGLIDPKFLKEESAKMSALFYLLDQLREEGHKVLVFSQFVSMLDIIKARLEVESRPFHYLTGQTKDRKGEIESFQTTKDPSVFMLSLKAGGAGLNLTSASYVILYDPWWNPAVENQAIDRTHRIGQKNKVIAYRLLTRETVEEKIRVLQHQKTQLVTNVLGDEGFASSLGMDDLAFILGTGGDADFGSDDEPEAKGPKAKKGSIIDAEVVSDADKADAAAKKAAKKTAKKAAKKNAKKAAKKAAKKK